MKRNHEQTVRRIGTITCGTSLILFGILFLLHTIVPFIHISFIFRLWPCIFIMLGIELLVGNYKDSTSFIYDKSSVLLLFLMMIFAMIMALINECMMYVSWEYIR